MYKTVTTLYIVLYGCFIIFARQPDYIDGETTAATIHFVKDSTSKLPSPNAEFSIGNTKYAVPASYPLRSLSEGQKVQVIYESASPKKGVLYTIWGYWILWDQLLISIVFYVILFQIAVGITSNPTPESLIEELENKEGRKKRYV